MSKSKQGQYIVKRGDTVESIARKLGMSPYALVSQNPSIRSRRLEQGESLVYYNASPQSAQQTGSGAAYDINDMLAGAAGAAGGALSNAYLRADTLEEALASLKRAAGLSNLSDQEAVEKAQQFRRQNLLEQVSQKNPGKVYDINKLLQNAQ